MTTVSGADSPCSRAAIFGVSPQGELFLPPTAAYRAHNHEPSMETKADHQVNLALLGEATIECPNGFEYP